MPLKQNWTDRDTVTATFLNQLASAVNSAVASLAGKYTKPAGGIPASDLAGNVLDKTTADTIYAPLLLVEDTIEYNPDGSVEYAVAGGIRTDYTWNPDGTCHTETSQGLVKTWTYDADGNPISSTVTEA